MTFYDPMSCKLRGRNGRHDFSGISENFNCDVNTEETYQTFEILINYLASSSCLFQTWVFWISQKIECLTIHSMTEIQILNFILLSLVKYWLSHCLSFYILIPLQIPYYILKDILFAFWNLHEAQYFTKYLESHHGFLLHNSMWKNNFVKCNRYTALEKCKQWKHKMQNLFLLETRKKITWQ